MTDQTELEIQRGVDATHLLAHPLMQEAFATIRQEIHQKWQSSPSRDEAGREKLWLMDQMLARVEMHLGSVIQTGQLASETLRMKVSRMTGRRSASL